VHTGECLLVAALANWDGMTCAGCGAYEALEPVQRMADLDALLDLTAHIRGVR